MRINEIELTNFKGVRALTLNFSGRDAKIYGDNATGKTTIMDAFIWLLTGKDHLGRSDLNFNIKTLDERGQTIPMLDHSVRASLEHNGETFELIRNFHEVWQKKTGTNIQTFNGHKTEYTINGVPKSEKEYTAFVEKIAPMELVYLLTMSGYFNEQIKAEERRKMLLDICGDVDDGSILALPEFAELAPYITRMVSVPDLKKANVAQKAKINDDIKSIPVAINVHTQYLSVDGLNADTEQMAIDSLQAEINAVDASISGIDNGETLANLRKELATLEAEQIQFTAKQNEERSKATSDLQGELSNAGFDVKLAETKIKSAQRQLNNLHIEIADLAIDRENALSAYRQLNAQSYAGDTVCPTCGQPLPADKVSEAIAQFNEQKSKSLEKNIQRGKKIASDLDEKRKAVGAATQELSEAEAELQQAEQKKATISKQIDDIMVAPRSVFDTSKIDAKRAEIDSLIRSGAQTKNELTSRRRELASQRSEHEQNLSRLRNAENAAREIDKLKAREKELAWAFEECEKIIALCDDFTNYKVKMLDEKISGAFRFARFKLTEQLVNGGLREVCETLVNGVPYSAANNAARINVGLDIIETFSAHYGETLPIFIDNAESITQIYPMDCHRADMDKPQVIQLVVDGQHKNITMEVI